MSLSKGKTTTFVSVNMPYNDLFLQSISTDRKSEWIRTKTNGNVRFGRIFCFSFIADVMRICNCYIWSLIQKHPVLSCPETKLVWLQKSLIHFITSRICWTKAKRQPPQKKPTWKEHAYFLDACNCDWGCPCQFNAKPTHGNCEGVAGYHIVTGSYGTNVKLDGLNMALIASWPGPIHEGHGKHHSI